MLNYTNLFVKLLMSVINLQKLIGSYRNSIRDDVKYIKMKSILLNHVRKMIETYLEYRKLETKVNSAKSITKKYSALTLDIVALTKTFIIGDKDLEKNLEKIKETIAKELFIRSNIVEQAIDNVTKTYALQLSAWIIQCDRILEANIKDDDMINALENNKVLQDTTLENIIVAYTINIEKLSKYIDERIAEVKNTVQEYEKSRREAQKSKKKAQTAFTSSAVSSGEISSESISSGTEAEAGSAVETGEGVGGATVTPSRGEEGGATTKRNKKRITGEPKATKRPVEQKVVAKGPIEAPKKLKVQESEKKLSAATSGSAKKKSVRAVAKSTIISKMSEAPAVATVEAPAESTASPGLVKELQKAVEATSKTIKGAEASKAEASKLDMGKKQKGKGKDLDSLMTDYSKLEKQQSKFLQYVQKLRDKIAKKLQQYDKKIKIAKTLKKESAATFDADELVSKLLGLSSTKALSKDKKGRKGKSAADKTSVSDVASDAEAVADLLKQQSQSVGDAGSASKATSETQAEKNEVVINQNNVNEVNNINLSPPEVVEQSAKETTSKQLDSGATNRDYEQDFSKAGTEVPQERQISATTSSSESTATAELTQSGKVSVTSSASKEVKPIPKEGESGAAGSAITQQGQGAKSGEASAKGASSSDAVGQGGSVTETRSKRFLGSAREKLVEGLANAKTKFMYALQGMKGFSTKLFSGILNGLNWIVNILNPFTFLFSRAFSIGATLKALDTQTKLADIDKELNKTTGDIMARSFEANAETAQRVIDTLRGERAREQIGEYALLADRKDMTASGAAQAQKFSMQGKRQASGPSPLTQQGPGGAGVALGFRTREEDIQALKQQQEQLNKELLEMQKRLAEYQKRTMETDKQVSDAVSASHQTQMQLEVMNQQASMKNSANAAEKRELYSY